MTREAERVAITETGNALINSPVVSGIMIIGTNSRAPLFFVIPENKQKLYRAVLSMGHEGYEGSSIHLSMDANKAWFIGGYRIRGKAENNMIMKIRHFKQSQFTFINLT